MEDWDQETLEKVVAQKHGTEKPSNATDIICKFFLDAVEKRLYGWCGSGLGLGLGLGLRLGLGLGLVSMLGSGSRRRRRSAGRRAAPDHPALPSLPRLCKPSRLSSCTHACVWRMPLF